MRNGPPAELRVCAHVSVPVTLRLHAQNVALESQLLALANCHRTQRPAPDDSRDFSAAMGKSRQERTAAAAAKAPKKDKRYPNNARDKNGNRISKPSQRMPSKPAWKASAALLDGTQDYIASSESAPDH